MDEKMRDLLNRARLEGAKSVELVFETLNQTWAKTFQSYRTTEDERITARIAALEAIQDQIDQKLSVLGLLFPDANDTMDILANLPARNPQ